MTKEVLISIKGLQFSQDEESDEIETIQPGIYSEKNGFHYLIYEDFAEEFEEPARNRMKFKNGLLELDKKGVVSVHMVFEEGKKNMASYRTPYGTMLIGLDTEKVTCRQTEDRLCLEVKYTLEANYEYVSDCTISLEAKTKGGETFC